MFLQLEVGKTDPLPQGKRECTALRDKEAELRITQYKGIAYQAEGMTVLELAKKYTQFLTFVKEDKHFNRYYEGICILFKTGLRISEFCGLTLADIDMDGRTINVNHQLQRSSKTEYIIEDTKTSVGTRVLPMTDEDYECFNMPRYAAL